MRVGVWGELGWELVGGWVGVRGWCYGGARPEGPSTVTACVCGWIRAHAGVMVCGAAKPNQATGPQQEAHPLLAHLVGTDDVGYVEDEELLCLDGVEDVGGPLLAGVVQVSNLGQGQEEGGRGSYRSATWDKRRRRRPGSRTGLPRLPPPHILPLSAALHCPNPLKNVPHPSPTCSMSSEASYPPSASRQHPLPLTHRHPSHSPP